MKKILLATALATGLASAGGSVSATEMSKGEVVKVDTKRHRLTIKHGPLENLGMPGMTMVFEVADPAMIEGVDTGTAVSFVAERVQGKLTITEID